MVKRLVLALAFIMISGLCLNSCTMFNFGGEFTYTEINDPNPAWVVIEYPTDNSTYATNDNTIYLSGSAFVSDTWSHCCPWDSGVAVKWSNSNTGESGLCAYYTDVTWPFMSTKWDQLIPINIGNNLITITSYEYLATPPDGYSRSTSITVTRN